jgi:uncharacterized membrane protein YfcA
MIVLALLGGALGSYVGSSKWNNKRLEYLLALVLTTAAIKLILF